MIEERKKYDIIYENMGNYAVSHKPKIDYVNNWVGSGFTVVDLGCGRGIYSRKIMEKNEVLGVELSSVCCEKYLGDINHKNMGILDFCEEGLTFDKAYSCDVLEHIPTDELNVTLQGISNIAEDFLFLVCTGSDIKHDMELHLSNFSFEEWVDIISRYYTINKSIKGFDEWPYIHIFECKRK